MAFIKSLLVKNMATRLLWETILALFRRITWQEVLEHLAIRLVKKGLRWIASLSKNTVDDDVVELIISQLERRGVEDVE